MKSKVLTTFINDRSGSIATCLAEAQKAYDTYIEDRKAEVDFKELLSLIEFDTRYDVVYDYTPVSKIPTGEAEGAYKLRPRGWTALNDAIMRAILNVEDRPEASDKKVAKIFVINTDGMENSSKEYPNRGNSAVRAKIKEKQDAGWTFVFLGASIEATETAIRDYGFGANTTMDYDTSVMDTATRSASSMVSRGLSTGTFAFASAERSASRGPKSEEQLTLFDTKVVDGKTELDWNF